MNRQMSEAQHRRNQLPQRAVCAANVVVSQRRQVDAHESDQRPEVEQLRAIVVSDEERSQQRNHADENHIVRGNPGPGMDGAEEFLWNGVAASHAIQQTRRPQLRSHAGANGRNQQRDADGFGHQMAAGDRGHVAECVLHFGGGEQVLGAQQLRAVDFSRRQKPVITQTSTVARKMFRLGLSTSSDKVEMPSNPM